MHYYCIICKNRKRRIAQVHYEHNIPSVIIRTISDKADHSALN